MSKSIIEKDYGFIDGWRDTKPGSLIGGGSANIEGWRPISNKERGVIDGGSVI